MVKRAHVIAIISASLAVAIAGSAYAFAQTPRFFLYRLGQAIDADDAAKVETFVNVEKTVDDYVTTAIKLAQASILAEAQSSSNEFANLGSMVAIGAVNSMADGLKVQISEQIRSQLDAALEQLDQPVTNYLFTRPIQSTGSNTAIVTISRPDTVDWSFPVDSIQLELEKTTGDWRVVGVSDRTIKALFEANQNGQTASTPPASSYSAPEPVIQPTPYTEVQQTSVPSAPPPTNAPVRDPLVGQVVSLTADSPSARINLRSEPRSDIPTRRYGLVGDKVLIQESTVGRDGYTWYKVQFQESTAVGWVRGDFVAGDAY